ncbi:aminodeoxychorismate lyase [Paraferrimonas sedimenticola]|uniref:Aminodeoxychorismate lyase n=1 Tax=Paraferrimonas sedimenticola TaxID=375674 RepID=A0AA37S0F5_9GAMM|nr:aminodeoxychorismate lyase [Paraferrimonas sedimenticola]GLP98087.1 4-amino-4-deoxychorismate lyase [Paraferrimonas sedimenticola]
MSKARAWVNGEAASVSPLDRGLAYGDGVFTTVRAANGRLCWWPAHQARLCDASLRLGLFADRHAFDAWFAPHGRFIKRQLPSAAEPVVIKVIITRGEGGRGYAPPNPCEPQCIVSLHDYPDYQSWKANGLELGIHSTPLGQQPITAGIKHLNRLEQVLLRQAWYGDEPEFMTRDTQGNIVGAASGNLAFIKKDTLYLPPVNQAGIAGVMRYQLMRAAIACKLNIDVSPINPSQLSDMSAALYTNALASVIGVNRIGPYQFDSLSWAERLREEINKLEAQPHA